MRPKSAFLAAAVLASLALPARADDEEGGRGGAAPLPAPAAGGESRPAAGRGEDVLVLKDGKEIRGRITGEDDASYAVKVGGALRIVEKSNVAEVRRGAPAPVGEEAGKGSDAGEGKKGEPETGRRLRKFMEERRKREEGAGGSTPSEPPPPLSADARAWAGFCIDRVLTDDPVVQRSAAEALRALGPPVLPLLEEAGAKADEQGRRRLDRVAALVKAPPGPPPGPAGRGAGKGPPQPGGGPGERGMALLERVRKELALDDDGARVVGGRLLEFGREVRETLQDARDGILTFEDARTRVAEQRTKLRESLKGSLTEDQLAKLDGILDRQFREMKR